MSGINVPADPRECFEKMTLAIHRIETMLTLIYGDGLANFQSHNDDIQDHYLWTCADLASEARALAEPLWDHLKGWRPTNSTQPLEGEKLPHTPAS